MERVYNKPHNKLIKDYKEINNLKDFRYYEKKEHKITVRLFKEDKEEIRKRSNNNITNYIELLLNDFINNILDTVEPI